MGPEIPTVPDSVACPRCGSGHVAYRVQRSGPSHRPLQERALAWDCRDCGAHWNEGLRDSTPAPGAPGAPAA